MAKSKENQRKYYLKRKAKKSGNSKTPPKTETIQASKAETPKILSANTIRKYGFESVEELIDYAQHGFIASASTFDRERREIKKNIHSLLDGVAVIENANRGVNTSFINYLSDNLDVGIDGYGNNSYLINLKRRKDGSKKRKRPKSIEN